MATVIYSPKNRFQKSTERRERWTQMANDSLLHDAIIHAQAEMSFAGFGPSEMKGVSFFIVALLNLSEDVAASKSIPVKQLVSYEEAEVPLPKQ